MKLCNLCEKRLKCALKNSIPCDAFQVTQSGATFFDSDRCVDGIFGKIAGVSIRCSWCNKIIEAGETYLMAGSRVTYWGVRVCLDCLKSFLKFCEEMK